MHLPRSAALLLLASVAASCGKATTSDAGFPPVGGGVGGGFAGGTGGGTGGGGSTGGGGGSPQGGGAGGGSDAGLSECATVADLTPCTAPDASTALCVSRACIPLAPCDAGSCRVSGPSFPLPDTNLRRCFGPSPNMTDGTIPCPGTPGAPACAFTDYCGEDAQYGWDTQHAAAARFTVTTPGGERVVTDAVTGLTWQGCARGRRARTAAARPRCPTGTTRWPPARRRRGAASTTGCCPTASS